MQISIRYTGIFLTLMFITNTQFRNHSFIYISCTSQTIFHMELIALKLPKPYNPDIIILPADFCFYCSNIRMKGPHGLLNLVPCCVYK